MNILSKGLSKASGASAQAPGPRAPRRGGGSAGPAAVTIITTVCITIIIIIIIIIIMLSSTYYYDYYHYHYHYCYYYYYYYYHYYYYYYICVYIYIYMYYLESSARGSRFSSERAKEAWLRELMHTPNLLTNIVDFRGFDSSTILIIRGGIPRPMGIS